MKAIYFEAFGGPEQLKLGELPNPIPADDEVMIKIEYAAVNPVDWKIRLGLLQSRAPHSLPIVPGWDAAGTVAAVGRNVTAFKKGDAVYAYCRKPTVKWGTYAEYVCLQAENVALKPSKISFAEAAAIPLSGLTAWQSLFDTAQLKKGETVLIHAGAGGVGSLAIQFAKQAGARVITTASESNHAYLMKLGADEIIDYRNQDVLKEIKKLAPEGLDIVFDTVGGQTYKDSFQLLKKGGRLVSLLEQPDEAMADQYKVKAYYVFVTPNGKELQQIAELVDAGKVLPIHIQEMPLEKAAEAQEINRQRHTRGKIVLKI